MSAEEAVEFENLSNFSAILEMRRWDEAAKDVNIPATGNQKYIKISETYSGGRLTVVLESLIKIRH